MVALKGGGADSFLARPDPARPIILLYGQDAGLVRERADALIASAVDNPSDPFSTVRIDGDDLANEPSRLIDEAMTVPLFGGRRAIRVRAGSKNFASGVETLTEMALKDCRVVIEAGDLRADSPLRKACERSKTAVAIGCYVDSESGLSRLIDEELRAAKLKIAPDARALLLSSLGADRQTSRNELRKLALYAHGDREITLAAVRAVIADASEQKVDPIVDGAFAGKPAMVEMEFAKAIAAGVSAVAIVGFTQRHAALLHKASLAVENGGSAESALQQGFPRLHFSRMGAAQTALRQFTPEKFAQIIGQLGVAALDCRQKPALADALAQRALIAIALAARQRA